ncbi:MAG: carboxypeptidase-like regulatory domain-containing protein, partial [Flavisolibacter sp.]
MGKLVSTLLGMLLITTQLLAQNNRTITGKVTDEAGTPIPNASVLVKGTQLGTSSNADGTFSLSVPADAKTLVISSLNYATQEIPISSTTNVVTAQLRGAAGTLAEVVVVGYGSQKRTDVSSSVAKVNG